MAERWVVRGTALAGAWIWFGASGLALLVLWWRAAPIQLPRRLTLTAASVRTARIEPLRLDITLSDGERLVVYRDEFSAADWCRLRRELLAGTTLNA